MNNCLKHREKTGANPNRGVVLLVTMIVLTVFALLGYTMASKIAAQRHRDNYIIDYTNACYARDSALKYALAVLADLNDVKCVERPNEPDFSDLFSMDEQKYREWINKLIKEQPELFSDVDLNEPGEQTDMEEADEEQDTEDLFALEDNDTNTYSTNNKYAADSNTNKDVSDRVTVRGPYGPAWPFVTEPVEFEIGTTTVKIETEDENAKYPAGWAIIDNDKVQRESQASFDTFLEWMGYDADRKAAVAEQLKQVAAIKPFKVEFQQVVQRTPVTTQTPNPARRGARAQRVVYKSQNVTPTDQIIKQTKDFSKLFHSSLIDTQMLSQAIFESEKRKESALKYMGLWGTIKVNINSAPRHVLEAAFAFGGDGPPIAEEIIKRRREKPFKDLEELRKELFRFADSIEKCKPYISTTSDIFSIHVTATSGAAKASAIVVVFKDGGKIEQIAIVSG